MDKYKLKSNKQFGFKQGLSTEYVSIKLTDNNYQNVDSNKAVICVLLDLAKAVDTVDHKILIESLEDMGFKGTVLRLMESHLLNRSHYVKI